MIRRRIAVATLSWGAGLFVGWYEPQLARARSSGMPVAGCVGCHSGGEHTVTMAADPPSIDPGQLVRMTVTVSGPGQVAGVHIHDDAGGVFSLVDGGGLREVDGGLTHQSPRSMSGGGATFRFDWRAPAGPGAVRFEVSSVAANGNGGSSGDNGYFTDHDFIYGCEAQTYYADLDRDGFGQPSLTRLACRGVVPENFSASPDDCDDVRNTVYPGAVELCNDRDDNCNEAIDDDYVPVMQYPDPDGDGFYSVDDAQGVEAFLGCSEPGYASEAGDCQPAIPEIHPGAEEVCNLFDDDCNGRVDERVRPQCGVGWCRRDSQSCDLADCIPGEPTEEVCNLLDDDCDDEIDEGDLCPDGQVCELGHCVAAGTIPTPPDEGGSGGEVPRGTSGGPGSADGGGSQEGGGGGAEDAATGCSVVGAVPRRSVWMSVLVLVGLRRRRKGAVRRRRADPATP